MVQIRVVVYNVEDWEKREGEIKNLNISVEWKSVWVSRG